MIHQSNGESGGLSPIQKEYLSGFFAGAAGRSHVSPTAPVSRTPEAANDVVSEPHVYGTPLSDLSKEEVWKVEQDPLDLWERIVACAEGDEAPVGADVFRFKYHGLFHVAPAQDSFMLRVRLPGNVMTAAQLHGLADMASAWGAGYGDVTTRGNIQLREFPPKHVVRVLMKLQDLGLSSRGAGADNVRNITATPTSGIDPTELYDVRPLARALQFYIANSRDLYGLPRKFNVSFDSGGRISVVADTNDIAFVATRVPEGGALPAGVYFRVLLAGITGHNRFAIDAGLALEAHECVPVAAAMLRVYTTNGDRTNRKKARLVYLLDRWGVDKYLAEVEKKLGFPLRRCAVSAGETRPAIERRGHIGVHAQRQTGLNYVGVAIPVGRMGAEQMHGLAAIAESCGDGELRPTVWQNVIVTGVPDASVDEVRARVRELGFDTEATSVGAGLVACTGNTGCRFSATNTKGQSTALAAYLDERFVLDTPLNIHLTGCAHSCAQHYVGDIGLLGTSVTVDGIAQEGYHVYVGGGTDDAQGLGREVFRSVPFGDLPQTLERMLAAYVRERAPVEPFVTFVRRHETDALRTLFASE